MKQTCLNCNRRPVRDNHQLCYQCEQVDRKPEVRAAKHAMELCDMGAPVYLAVSRYFKSSALKE
jgi:hypothetical protein